MDRDGKKAEVQKILRVMGRVVVAFSGGVDSTFLLGTAIEVLGKENVVAVTARSATYPVWEFEESKKLADLLGARQIVIATEELDKEQFASNPPERCYFCKEELFCRLSRIAAEEGAAFVLDGTNLDDLGDYRPGRKAAAERGVRSPLLEARLTKEDIRLLSREMGLPSWDKPACACLSSRFPYGTRITKEKLDQVEQGEDYLRLLGFKQFRLRHHGEVVRIEISREQFPLMMEKAQEVVCNLKAAGFSYVALDLEGYRTGSMNEVLPCREQLI